MAPHKQRLSESGFTLIEVILAVVLLATALTVLLGLQTSVIDQTIRDRNRELALLTGRRILAQLELGDGSVDDIVEAGPLDQLVKKICQNEPDDSEEELKKLAHFDSKLSVVPWGIDGLKEDAMKKITLVVSWTESPLDKVELVYFVPGQPNDEDG